MTMPRILPRLDSPAFWAIAGTVLFVLAVPLPGTKFIQGSEHYLPLHIALESFAVFVALMIFTLTWVGRRDRTLTDVILGSGFLAVGLINFGHILSYAGMPFFITPSGAEKAINFWLATRSCVVVTLLAVGLGYREQHSPDTRTFHWTALLALSLTLGVYWVVLWHADWLPRTFIPDTGLTPLKITIEVVIVTLSLVAAVILWRSYHITGQVTTGYLAAAAWVSGLGELFFTVYATVTDLYNLLGHCFIAFGYALIFRALVVRLMLEPRYKAEQAEAQSLLAKELAEAASRAKSTFLANMSHELRTPLSGILGMTDLALRHATEPKLRDQLTKVIQSSQHLLHVINDILDISKIEAERMTLEQVNFKLGRVLENLTSLIGQKVQAKGLKLRIELAPGIAQQTYLGDPLRLSQVLLNLTGNALKFTERGEIVLRCRVAAETQDDVLLHCEVQDSGIGISAEDQEKLFTAFEQADGSMTRKYGGTGLGLAISKRLVQMMGGEIGIESSVGQGSTFWFTLRLQKTTETAVLPEPTFTQDTAEARLKATFAGTRVLLVEDEPINQEVSRGLLEDAGLSVDLAEDGEQAVAMAQQTPYALILMDMQMPHMNGVDATQAIRAGSLNQTTPILAMTANAFDEDRQTCLAAGMNDHIGKPIEPERLFESLLKWLSRATR